MGDQGSEADTVPQFLFADVNRYSVVARRVFF